MLSKPYWIHFGSLEASPSMMKLAFPEHDIGMSNLPACEVRGQPKPRGTIPCCLERHAAVKVLRFDVLTVKDLFWYFPDTEAMSAGL